ncbi:MAG: SPOR domain-containing protein, partial [Thiobacillaceae bacterium]
GQQLHRPPHRRGASGRRAKAYAETRNPDSGRPAPPAPAPTPVARGFVLQLGVFSNPDNAKQLLERLNREGIRAYSETRVQVGPFRSREEAEKARLALDRLGIRAVITPQGATR